MSDHSSSKTPKPDSGKMTVFQQMSRQPNYRTMRASERIFKAWNKLPLFEDVLGDPDNRGIQSVGFFRRVFKEEKPAPPFNSSMARAKIFRHKGENDLEDENSIESILKVAADNTDFGVYLSVVENENSSHPSVRRAARYFRDLLKSENYGLELSDDLGQQRIHHHALELYRRLPYTKVLNDFIYPILCPEEKPECGVKALLFDAAWGWERVEDQDKNEKCLVREPLPRFVALDGLPDLEKAENQQDFEPFFVGPSQIDPKTKNAVRKWHNKWFRSIEATEGLMDAGDFLILAVPIREGWKDDTPYGSYLGHLALFLRRERFFGPDDYDEEGRLRRMKELEDERREKVWAQMVRFHEGLTEFLNGREWISPAPDEDSWFTEIFGNGVRGRLHWEAMRRDLDDFVDAHYESEFDEWLDIEFPVGAGHADVQRALKEVAANTDGWTQEDCSKVPSGVENTRPNGVGRQDWENYQAELKEYREYFEPSQEDSIVTLKLQAETREPGEQPERVFEFCLKKRADTILPGIPPDGEVRIKYFRRLWKRYNHLYQRFLRRAAFATAGKQSSAHDYSKDIGSALLRLSDFKKELDRSREAVLDQTRQLAPLAGQSAEIGERIVEQANSWSVPNLDWFTAVQFTNAHQQTESLGALFGGPPECIKLLEDGKLRDMNELVRMLVWLPIPFFERKDKHRKLIAYAPEKLNHPATWHGLFRYDMVPNIENSTFHDALGLKWNTILKEGVTQAVFKRRFKIPVLGDGQADTPILWDALPPDRLKRLDGLLPLLVFSLRFAYQCSWAKTLMDEPDEPIRIDLAGQPLPGGGHQIAISFPSPIPVTTPTPESMPYYGEWLRQIRHYSNRNTTYPWRVVTPLVTPAGEDSVMLHLAAGG